MIRDDRTVIVRKGLIPRNFKTFIFKPKMSFLRKNDKNDN